MQGMVDESKAFLESSEGKDFEKDMQESFLGGSPSTQSKWGERIAAQQDKGQDLGNAGQSEDSISGMNKASSGPSTSGNTESTDSSAYNQAASDNATDEGAYTDNDTTSSGGYGVNAGGSSFSQANQSGMGGNQPGQFK